MRLIRSHRDVWVSHQNFRLLYSTVYGRLWLSLQRLCLEVTSQIFKEERFSPGVLLLGKWKASRKLEWIVSYISLSMNSRRGKNKMRRELLFLLELFCFLFKPGILLKFIHFQLYIQNKKLILFVIPGLPNILTLIIFCTSRFSEYTSFFFCHFAVCSGMDNRKTG